MNLRSQRLTTKKNTYRCLVQDKDYLLHKRYKVRKISNIMKQWKLAVFVGLEWIGTISISVKVVLCVRGHIVNVCKSIGKWTSKSKTIWFIYHCMSPQP